MADDLLANARRQAEMADDSIRAAALLRIARAESAGNIERARRTLLEGLKAVGRLPSPGREHLLEEGRYVAAAISPELVNQIPAGHFGGPPRFGSGRIVQTMVTHGHVDPAVDYLLQQDDAASFPFAAVGTVLHRLGESDPRRAASSLQTACAGPANAAILGTRSGHRGAAPRVSSSGK